ncbi:MAG: alpha/beta hydrolase [Candidatus Binatia bacterium]
MAGQRPDRVRGLALLDTSLAGVDEATARQWRGRMVGRRQGHTYATYAAARAAFRFVPPEPGVPTAIVDGSPHAPSSNARRASGRSDSTAPCWQPARRRRRRRPDRLRRHFALPLWIGRGTGSFVTPRAEIEALRARRDDVEARDFPGAHHFFLSHPRAAGEALRAFLDRLPGDGNR